MNRYEKIIKKEKNIGLLKNPSNYVLFYAKYLLLHRWWILIINIFLQFFEILIVGFWNLVEIFRRTLFYVL